VPVANAGVGLPGVDRELVVDPALNVEDTGAGVAVGPALTGIDSLHLAAVDLGTHVVEMGHQSVADLRVDKTAVIVKQVGLVLVDQVLETGEVGLPPREWNLSSANSGAAAAWLRKQVFLRVLVIEIGPLRVRAVVGHPGIGPGRVAAVRKGALRLLRAVMNQRSPVLVDGVAEQSVSRALSEGSSEESVGKFGLGQLAK
jgi:hypothetical protein